ncbi:hypothetical protein, conserved [Babesia bigemina]|uniref:Uncharacterized protein n=1 Tax=Babesia bigemina TaxID=5866 RepID=A0A061D8X7_BABBI|nr:hypothetical protein, conserved [Babesia bigemina]CDR97003.1 hypothetical protein, conserved [Babesia bigemina]|eukprot:XP_012769189.1 hypothetical protein, conserved [Babesia bigemina]
MDVAAAANRFRRRMRRALYRLMARSEFFIDRNTGEDHWMYKKVKMMANRLVSAMYKTESAIVMVTGPPGSGKSYLVTSALMLLYDTIAMDVEDQGVMEFDTEFEPMEGLDGLSSDAESVSEMPWRVEIIMLEIYNYRDEMKCMKHLALLLEKLAGVSGSRCGIARCQEVQERIMHCMKLLRKSHVYVVIALEGMDVLTKGRNDCSERTGSCHRRQGMLYFIGNMLACEDIAFALVGVTPDVRTMERLEKRVRSRFMHETIHCDRTADYDAVAAPGKLSLLGKEAVLFLDDESKQMLGEGLLCGRSATSTIAATCAQLYDDAFEVMEDGELCISSDAVTAKLRDSGTTRWFESIVEHLSLPQHYVLVSLARLHLQGIMPLTLLGVERDLKEMCIYYPNEKKAMPHFNPDGMLEPPRPHQRPASGERPLQIPLLQDVSQKPNGLMRPRYAKMDHSKLLPTHLAGWLAMAVRALK